MKFSLALLASLVSLLAVVEAKPIKVVRQEPDAVMFVQRRAVAARDAQQDAQNKQKDAENKQKAAQQAAQAKQQAAQTQAKAKQEQEQRKKEQEQRDAQNKNQAAQKQQQSQNKQQGQSQGQNKQQGQSNNNKGQDNKGQQDKNAQAQKDQAAKDKAAKDAQAAKDKAAKDAQAKKDAENKNNNNQNKNNNNNNNQNKNNNNVDIQSSLTLDPSQVQPNLANDGQDVPADGQVASLTSTNNFINFCATQKNLPLTNGKQVIDGSCNPTIMGVIIAKNKAPSSKFQNPKNLDKIKANKQFTIQMKINNLETGFFVNAQENYFAAPAFTNGGGILQGHSHVVVEQIDSLTSTGVTNPENFAFFKGFNDAAVNGILSADVTDGLPAGVYRMGSINTAANHQPALVGVAQHGMLDDIVYFTVED